MNVSSVKNLNGEVLSAVQDASLTNVIQTNSGNWQDITAYQNASATYLTEVSIPESATWNEVSTTVQTNSAKIDDTVISYQTNSGTFLTAHQAISAEEWNGCYDNVNTNSGAWGGSALPISAGPGIKFEMVDNTLVASTDETLLWSGNGTSINAFTVSEPLTNFKEIVFNITPNIGDGVVVQKVIVPMVGNNTSALYLVFDSTWKGFTGINFSYKFNNTGMSAFSLSTAAWFGFKDNGATTGHFNTLYGYEIYGVKRIAGGN